MEGGEEAGAEGQEEVWGGRGNVRLSSDIILVKLKEVTNWKTAIKS